MGNMTELVLKCTQGKAANKWLLVSEETWHRLIADEPDKKLHWLKSDAPDAR